MSINRGGIGLKTFFFFWDHRSCNHFLKQIDLNAVNFFLYFYFLETIPFSKLICQYLRSSHRISIKKIKFAPETNYITFPSKISDIRSQVKNINHIWCKNIKLIRHHCKRYNWRYLEFDNIPTLVRQKTADTHREIVMLLCRFQSEKDQTPKRN